MRERTAIAGIGQSAYGRFLPESQLRLGARALKSALDDAGLEREDIDGMAIHLGWPLGVDYDRLAEVFNLDIRYVNQTWLHGRFVTQSLQHAAMAVAAGLADVVACVTAISFTRERQILGGPGDFEGSREEGGTHGESPPYGLTAPAGGNRSAATPAVSEPPHAACRTGRAHGGLRRTARGLWARGFGRSAGHRPLATA